MEFLATIIGVVASMFGGITFLIEKRDKTVFGDSWYGKLNLKEVSLLV